MFLVELFFVVGVGNASATVRLGLSEDSHLIIVEAVHEKRCVKKKKKLN